MTEDKRSEDLVKRCNQLMRQVAGLAKGQDAEWLALDMGMGQFKAMLVLKEHGQQTVGGLARILKISEPSASLLLEKLVTRDLVVRSTDPIDRRRTLVALSEAGDELMACLRRSSEAQLTAWLGGVAEDDLHALCQGLEALLVSIQNRT
jgi:DNA-binding MarR family transcriptional regulator